MNKFLKIGLTAGLLGGGTILVGCSTVCKLVPAVPGCKATPTPTVCVSDCNGDGSVDALDLIVLTNIRLGNKPITACSGADTNHDGTISAAEFDVVQHNAETSCGK